MTDATFAPEAPLATNLSTDPAVDPVEKALAEKPEAKKVRKLRITGGPNSTFVRYVAKAFGPLIVAHKILDEGSRKLAQLVLDDPNRDKLLRYVGEFESMLKGEEIPPAPPSEPMADATEEGSVFSKAEIEALVTDVSLDDPLESLLDERGGAKEDPLTKAAPGGIMYDALMHYMQSFQPGNKAIHPFVEAITHEDKRYIGVGTYNGRSRRDPTIAHNINCALRNFKKIRDVSDEYLAHRNGRPVVVSCDDDHGGTGFFWLLYHKPDLEVRFWINVLRGNKRADDPRGIARIMMCDDEKGWRPSKS